MVAVPSRASARWLAPVAVVLLSASFAEIVHAQPPPEPAPVPAPRDTVREELAPEPGGLTLEKVGERAAATSPTVRTRNAELRAAAARVDQAFVNYFPKLTVTATYTRLSPVENSLGDGGGGGAIVGTANAGPVTVGPCPGVPAATCVLDSAGIPAAAGAFAVDFPVILNNYSIMTSLLVPISDYVFRLSQAHASADHAEEAKRLDVEAAALQSAADAKISFLNWLRARGQRVVAGEAVAQSEAHVVDGRRVLDAGLTTRADVLRLEAQVARAQQLEAEARTLELVAEQQVRAQLHLPPGAPLKSAVDVDKATPKDPPDLEPLVQEALRKRLELKAIDKSLESTDDVETVTNAAYLPRIDAFANATYANPNPRSFPQQEKWDFTWDLGVRLTWTVNDTFATLAQSAEARANTAAIAERRETLEDAVRIEVTQAWGDVHKARPMLVAAEREVEAATAALEETRKLFLVGNAKGADIVDAETALTRARLSLVDARIALLAAEVRLDHAVGRDVGTLKPVNSE